MKINWKRLLRVAGRLIRAAPMIVDAVEPVLRNRRRSNAERNDGARASPPASAGHEPEVRGAVKPVPPAR